MKGWEQIWKLFKNVHKGGKQQGGFEGFSDQQNRKKWMGIKQTWKLSERKLEENF